MSFFEMSARIPLFIHWPGEFSPRSIDTPVSLLDVLPTLVELATGDAVDPATYVTILDGRSLVPLMTGGQLARGDRITAEFAAEGSIAPCFMIREGRFKFIWCETDPPLLYDLEADPDELTNLAADPAHRERVRTYTDELVSRYDPPALRAWIIQNQQVRLMVADASGRAATSPGTFNRSKTRRSASCATTST
jgi:choline-sulfatase